MPWLRPSVEGMVRVRFLFASDSFKGSLSSRRVAELLTEELATSIPGAASEALYVADGGEGTLEAIVASVGGELRDVLVQGPMGSMVGATFALLSDGRAVIEAAAANGLTLVPRRERDPMRACTFGVGQLVLAAVDAGARDITVGIGGSATNDAGMGMLRALGVRFQMEDGSEPLGGAQDLALVSGLDVSGLDPRLAECSFRVMCDVTNPLCGWKGATHVFGPQKGLRRAIQRGKIDTDMAYFAKLVAQELGRDCSEEPGAGAAGGLGFAFRAFLDAELRSGIDCVLDLVGFDEVVARADICVTGEGHLDAQTAGGKVIEGVARHCAAAGVPCVAIVGGADPAAVEAGLPGLAAVVPCVGDVCELDAAMAGAEHNMRLAARRLFGLLELGGRLRG